MKIIIAVPANCAFLMGAAFPILCVMLRFAAILLALSTSFAKADRFVDVELVIAVDVSYSVSTGEGDVQRIGYADALESPEVIRAITGGLHGRAAITYVEWADDLFQKQIIPWRVISTPEDARGLAAELRAAPIARSGATSISSALLYSALLFEKNPWHGLRRIIDISGDGPNNVGPVVDEARDAVLASGITINGLPLLVGTTTNPDEELLDLEAYFEDCVIGGPGAFMIAVTDWALFGDAITRKLQLELSGLKQESIRFAAGRDRSDCLFGERLQRRKLKESLDAIVPGGKNRWITDDDF